MLCWKYLQKESGGHGHSMMMMMIIILIIIYNWVIINFEKGFNAKIII